jgi:hypothetical protein
MKRKLIKTIRPKPGNNRNRLTVEIHDFYENDEVIGVGYLICSKNWHGDRWWVNSHHRDLDELIRMLEEARELGKKRMSQIHRIRGHKSLEDYEGQSYTKKGGK